MKRAFTDLQGTCLCCISHCKWSTDCCIPLPELAEAGHWSCLPSLCCDASVDGWEGRLRGEGGCSLSVEHTTKCICSVASWWYFRDEHRICWDCLRMDSLGQLVSLWNGKSWAVAAKKSFFFVLFKGGQGEGREQIRKWSESELQNKTEKKAFCLLRQI